MRALCSLLILAVLVTAPCVADNRGLSDLENSVFSAQSVANNATVTAVVRTGYAETFSLDTYFTTTGTLAGTIYFDYSNNNLSGTSTLWPSLDVTDTAAYPASTPVAAALNPKIKTHVFMPCGYTRVRFKNTTGVPASISRFTLFKR